MSDSGTGPRTVHALSAKTVSDRGNHPRTVALFQQRLSAISLEVHSRSAAQLAQSWGADPRTLHALSAKAVSDRGQTWAVYKSSAHLIAVPSGTDPTEFLSGSVGEPDGRPPPGTDMLSTPELKTVLCMIYLF